MEVLLQSSKPERGLNETPDSDRWKESEAPKGGVIDKLDDLCDKEMEDNSFFFFLLTF